MATNPLIALQAQGLDTASPIQRLIDNRDREEARDLKGAQVQQGQERLALERSKFVQQLEAFELEKLDKAQKRRLTNNIRDSVGALAAFDSGGEAGLKAFVARNLERNAAQGLDSRETEEIDNLISSGRLDEAVQILRTNEHVGTRLGLIQPSAEIKAPESRVIERGGEKITQEFNRKTGEFEDIASAPRFQAKDAPQPLTAIGKARKDLIDGSLTQAEFKSIVAQESGLKSPEQINQLATIERMKADIEKADPAYRLSIQKLEQDLAAGKLKIDESEDTLRRANELKGTALRLISSLIENQDGVRAAVGPFDSSFASPTFFKGTLKAQTAITQLRNILTAENLGLMSGVLSESDVKIITGIAGGGLDIEGDDDAFLDELNRMKTSFEAEGISAEAGQLDEPVTLEGGVVMRRRR